MAKPRTHQFDTLTLHAGAVPDPATGARATPIYQTTTFVDPRNLDLWRSAIRPETRLLFGETLGSPGLDVLDIPRVAALAHEHGLPLLVDSTFTTPWLVRPFDHGADLVFHSATKFLSGHGILIGGLLVDSGRFAWDAAGVRD